MSRSILKTAIRAEVVAASGLAEDRVVWDRQKIGTRPLPALELRLEGPTEVGALNGERIEEYDAAGLQGADVALGVAIDLEYVLRVQARAATHDEAHAVAYRAKLAFRRPVAVDRLGDAGIVVVEGSPILDVGELVETEWQGRAAFTIRLRVGSVEVDPTERTTFIESAPVTGSAI